MAFLIGILGLVLFAPARTLDFPRAWIYLALFATSAALITAYLATHDPALLERRVRGPGAESAPLQKIVQAVAGPAFIAMFLVASLDRRFAWSPVPLGASIAGDVAVALGFLLVFVVFRENTYTAATIEIAPDQTVVSTGPYAIVRHPMYVGGLLIIAGTPLALGSSWGLVLFFPLALAIIVRLLDEEMLLSRQLAGYAEYRQRVRYRLIPGIW